MEYNSENRICQNCKNSFVIEPEDFGFYEKMGVPAPSLCPDCRFKRRAIWRNETTLYTGRKCAKCGKSIVSMYNPKSPYTIYCHECYNSDSWDPRDYAMDYDENRSFFKQFGELIKKVPKSTTYMTTASGPNINSEYTNMAGGNKNCYLLFNVGKNENTLYARGVFNARDSLDIYFGTDLERCYETINVDQSAGV